MHQKSYCKQLRANIDLMILTTDRQVAINLIRLLFIVEIIDFDL